MKPETGKQKQFNNYLRYSGVGFQIAVTIGVGVFIGYELDKQMRNAEPYCMLVFAMAFIPLGLYIGLRGVAGKKE